MFNHIGEKIKGFAMFLFWLTAILGLIGGIVIIVSGIYNSVYTYEKVIFIIVGILVIIAGFIFAWLQNFVLYGYGELIDSNQKILEILEEQKNTKKSK